MTTAYHAAWRQAREGTATIEWADASGSHSVSISTGTYAHSGGGETVYRRLVDGSETTVDYGVLSFADTLQAAMDAATAQTVTVDWAAGTYYTLTCTGGTFSITFPATAAGERMRKLLGMTGNRTSATTYSSQTRPRFYKETQIDARTSYDQPAAIDGQVSSARAGSGLVYHLGPTAFAREARWEHHFEPRARLFREVADADTVASGHPWTWEDLFEHALQGLPIFHSSPDISDAGLSLYAIQVPPGFARSAFRRLKTDMDTHQIVRIEAQMLGYVY